MITERSIDTATKNMLLNNEAFQYAHLVKFERPSRPDSNTGQVSTSKQRYTYLTDASRDVIFDDGSIDHLGVANTAQTYVANKVIKVSSVQETTEAKASSFSLVLDGNGIGAAISGTATVTVVDSDHWDVEFPTYEDLTNLGFREGDKVTLSGAKSGTFNISRFRAANIVRLSIIDDSLTAGSGTITMSLSSEEIMAVLLDKNSSSYSSFINREVFIYRAYFQEGLLIGTPFLLFKGIISGVGFDDGDIALQVSWNLTSHWGDFSQVRGRLTSDDFHRALDQNGVPQPGSALKPIYAYDKGFIHSETSLNILAQYSVQVEKQEVKAKSGFLGLGIGSKVKVKKYFVTESRTTELDFQLQAKSIPVIYGVKNIPGVPIFADTLNDDTSTVYVIYVLGEGELGGIYDIYVNNNSLICNDKADFDARSVQSPDNTVELICRGRADRGDVLTGSNSVSSTPVSFYNFQGGIGEARAIWSKFGWDLNSFLNTNTYVEPVVTSTDSSGAGIYDGLSIHLTSPQDITLDFFSGKPGQKAAASLVAVSKANNFKIQNDYWNDSTTPEYWGPNHRLIDTAYAVSKFKIAEGETTIPDIEFIVRGKLIDCYNYDYSYNHYSKASSESADNFNLGDYVDLKDMSNNTLNAGVQIIDKWTFANSDGTINTRFRFSYTPNLQYTSGVPLITKFKMVKGASTWTMITYNYKESEGTNSIEWKTPITAASADDGYLKLTFTGGSNWNIGGDPLQPSGLYSIVESDGSSVSVDFFKNAILSGSATTTTLKANYLWNDVSVVASSLVGKYLVRRDVISLPGTVQVDGYYVGFKVNLVRIDSITGKKTSQTKHIIDYTSGIATIDGVWDYGFHPKSGDLVSVTPINADKRISINPAIQLMDYICSTTYGRGLNAFIDLNFNSWLNSARVCDTRSDITVQLTSTPTVSANAIYRYPASGNILWQGSVVGNEGAYVQFTNILGKLTYSWNSWRTFKTNELVYVDNILYQVTSDGTITTKPTHTSGSVGSLTVLSGITLTKVSGTGPSSIITKGDGNPIRALKNGITIPGYSLYDADGVDYWRLIGWDEFSQRCVTLHQTNLLIDTSLPLFDNVNSFLQHFGGILRYSEGKYSLDVEQAESLISNTSAEYRNITADHIIGKIRITDEGIKSAYNSLTASYTDPANKFESRNISFFNSTYLKTDRNVPKKGNLTVPGITNYYNTRLLADKFLNKSRFGMSIAFNMAPRGLLLQAGQVIQLQYPRYNWIDKKFRISTITHQEDATVDIVAEEYDDSFYGLTSISKQAGSGLLSNMATDSVINPPSNLIATNTATNTEDILGIKLSWDNNPVLEGNKNAYTEIYSSYSNNLFLTISNITSNVWTSSVAHKLKIGEQVSVTSSNYPGIYTNDVFYVLSTPTTTTFTVSLTKGGSVYGLSDDTTPEIILNTSSIVDTVPISTTNYVDIIAGVDIRTKKYYWLRHKIIKA